MTIDGLRVLAGPDGLITSVCDDPARHLERDGDDLWSPWPSPVDPSARLGPTLLLSLSVLDRPLIDVLRQADWRDVDECQVQIVHGLARRPSLPDLLALLNDVGLLPADVAERSDGLDVVLRREPRKDELLTSVTARLARAAAPMLEHAALDLPRTVTIDLEPGWLPADVPVLSFDPRWTDDLPLLRVASPEVALIGNAPDSVLTTRDVDALREAGTCIVSVQPREDLGTAVVLDGRPVPLGRDEIRDRYHGGATEFEQPSVDDVVARVARLRRDIDEGSAFALFAQIDHLAGTSFAADRSVLCVSDVGHAAERDHILRQWRRQQASSHLLLFSPEASELFSADGVDVGSPRHGRAARVRHAGGAAARLGSALITWLDPDWCFGPQHLSDLQRASLLSDADLVVRSDWFRSPAPGEVLGDLDDLAERGTRGTESLGVTIRSEDATVLAGADVAETVTVAQHLIRAATTLGARRYLTHGLGVVARPGNTVADMPGGGHSVSALTALEAPDPSLDVG